MKFEITRGVENFDNEEIESFDNSELVAEMDIRFDEGSGIVFLINGDGQIFGSIEAKEERLVKRNGLFQQNVIEEVKAALINKVNDTFRFSRLYK